MTTGVFEGGNRVDGDEEQRLKFNNEESQNKNKKGQADECLLTYDEGVNTEDNRLKLMDGKMREYWLDGRERALGLWADEEARNRRQYISVWHAGGGIWELASLWHWIHADE